MRNLWATMRRPSAERAVVALLAATLAVGAAAQNVERIPECEREEYGARAHVNGDYQTMRHIRAYWTREAKRLTSANKGCYDFALVGNDDSILRVTVNADEMFTAGDTTMTTAADALLFPLLRYLRDDGGLATVIVACHSDNNGSIAYLEDLTATRAAVIGRWMEKQKVAAGNIDCYGWAYRSPRTTNDSMRRRAQNRRVNFYLVPNRHMLRLAKKDKL